MKSLFRVFILFIVIACLSAFGYFYKDKLSFPSPSFSGLVENKGEWVFQAKFSPEKIVPFKEFGKFKLSASPTTFEEKFYPFLILELKIWQQGEIKKGHVVWDMIQGEMLQDLNFEDASQGFKDCLVVKASANELEVLRLLNNQGDSLNFQQIKQSIFFSQKDTEIQKVLQSGLEKRLFLKQENKFLSFLKKPDLDAVVFSSVQKFLDIKEGRAKSKMDSRFSARDLTELTQAYFGPGFAVVDSHRVYLPVFYFKTTMQDKIERKQYWNAVTGNLLRYPKVI
ncbi:hypothetical protein AB751O23_AG_00040 [Chlamydiales bacterium SCGC AB-751-O23]|jgi:hypothetical protein|nr:hypothetical protein AB751O23_AG_00040 [Chlamydiales bacterium SCGC AB-751-O23]